ncbi:MAG: Na(+)-translocating NADH-quinone reductase subunit A [Martelella sp.]|uniref:Na(+)-translocating NADH-quinone reductase subunit A n=1 Tax=unclassified Martelella TaxID=2629616 RepID=UPI000C547392|nr:Na(+)-translocating NADH-quinone reductase subunit A [Martelella sp.]MAU19385.1 Na(+)-translocating NADH-quinone reductase subunit A [Martelella sp.]
MVGLFGTGLSLTTGSISPDYNDITTALTVEAALTPARGEALRATPLVGVDDIVSQGQPLLGLRNAPDIQLVAPMAGRVAAIDLEPGRRLTRLLLFAEDTGARFAHDVGDAEKDAASLRSLLKASGLWRRILSRPFGRMPGPDETPSAIIVMATDSRPGAPSPVHALEGREEALARGLSALGCLVGERLFFCEAAKIEADLPQVARRVRVGTLHPLGLAGLQVHRLAPASLYQRVWDIHAEDVADIGELIETGMVPETRLVSVTGPALTEQRLVRCQPGADMRGLCLGFVRPGPHHIIAGSHIDGHPGHWLGPRDRQVTVLGDDAGHRRNHWFSAALTKAARPLPIIPTAALEQALGGDIPAVALIRALSAGDQETATRLGALSLVEEDLALADYVTAAEPSLSTQLRVLLNRIEQEEVAA